MHLMHGLWTCAGESPSADYISVPASVGKLTAWPPAAVISCSTGCRLEGLRETSATL